MFRLFYRSTAAYPELDPTDLTILREAISFNARADITGYLWRAESQFFQVLEGARDTVEALFTRITDDPRHHDVEVLATEENNAERLFDSWSMGYDSVGAELLGLGLSDIGARPAVDADQARNIMVAMAQSARDAAQFGSPFPYARKPGESEADYLERLSAAT